MLYPTTDEVLASQERATECWLACCVPVPVNVWVRGESTALLTKDIVPGALPAVCGAKVTVYWMLFPAFTVNGNVTPLTEYPSPFHAAEDTVTSAPLADKVPV